MRAIKEGKTHYPANDGILELRAAAATHLSLLSGGRPVNADHIVVSNGSKQSLFNACFTLFGPGDVVAKEREARVERPGDRKSTRLNSSHGYISYAVFCL